MANPTYRYINSPEQGVLKSSKGVLHRLILGWSGYGGIDITLRDGVEETSPVISMVRLSQEHPSLSIDYQCEFANGLFFKATGYALSITIVYD